MADAKCLKCKSTTENTYAIQCQGCNKWAHTKCVSMVKAVLLDFEKELKKPNGKRWMCQVCEHKDGIKKTTSSNAGNVITPKKKEYTLNDVMEKLGEIDSKYNMLIQKYNEQVVLNENLKLQIEQLETKINRLESQDSHGAPQQNNAVETIQEINEREVRKKNIVMFGVPECDSDEPEQRKHYDLAYAKNMFEETCPEVVKDCIRVFRIGSRIQGKTRPMKIIMESENDVKRVFSKVKEIRKKQKFSKVIVSNDKTKQQLSEYKTKKEELKRRIEEGENNIKLKFINGEPKIIKLKN